MVNQFQMNIQFLDGGMGFELNKYYSDFGQKALESDNQLILDIYKQFINLGCSYITTCNYVCRPHLDGQWMKHTQKAVGLVQTFKCESITICGSLPPYYESYIDFPITTEFKDYYESVVSIMKNKVDLFLVETCCSYNHASEIVKIIYKLVPNARILLSLYPLHHIDVAKICQLKIEGLLLNCCSFDQVKYFYESNSNIVNFETFGFYCNKINEFKHESHNMNKLQTIKTTETIDENALHKFLSQIKTKKLIIGGCCGYGIDEMKYLIDIVNSFNSKL